MVGLKMGSFEEELTRTRRREWLVPMLMLAVVGVLTASVVVVVFFYSDLQQLYEEYASVYLFNFLLLGFVVLAFIFMGYLALKELSSKKLKAGLIQQRATSRALETRVTELEAVHELTSLVSSEMALFDILDSICKKARKTLGADQSSLFLYDPKTNRLLCVSMWGPENDLVKNAAIQTGKSIAGWVIEHGKPLCLDRESDESQFVGFVKKDKRISSSLCLPLMVKNEARGVLNLTVFDQKKKFAQSDLKLASIFAENAAIAIDKTGLYERLKKQADTMKNIISELKATQDKYVQPETVRALSNLASGMAHDFRSTLSTILEKIQLALREISEASIPENVKRRALKLLRTTEQLATNGAETAKHIRTFAGTFQGGPEKHFEKLDINAIVEEVVKKAKRKCGDETELKGTQIQIHTVLEELSTPMGSRAEIKDVLTSMIYNSIDALPKGGEISITTKMRDDGVEIVVRDDGTGMNDDVKRRVFEPFFTTKKEGGYGIGLSTARSIVSSHNGEISVSSKPNQGTSFTITLPTSGERKPVSPAQRS
jgi:signal transduction histidine kinase